MKRTAVQLVQDAWTAGRDGTPVDGIGAEAARMDAARIGQRRQAREMRQEMAMMRMRLADGATVPSMMTPKPGPKCRWAGKTCDCLECIQAQREVEHAYG